MAKFYQLPIGPITFHHGYIVGQGFNWPCRIFLSCRVFSFLENWRKRNKKWFSKGQVVLSSNFLMNFLMGSCWLISLTMLSDRWNNNNRLLRCFCPNISAFFRMRFGEFFLGFSWNFWDFIIKHFFKRLYLWAQESYRYNFVVDVDATARRNVFWKTMPNFFGCRIKLRACFSGEQVVPFSIFGAHAGWLFQYWYLIDDTSTISSFLFIWISGETFRRYSRLSLGENFFGFFANFVTSSEFF